IGWTSFPFPLTSFNKGYVIKPTAIPVEMLEVRGIDKITAKAGNASSNFFHSIFSSPAIIYLPTIIKAGAVIDGQSDIASIMGEKNNVTINSATTTSEVSPERPPTATPEVDST